MDYCVDCERRLQDMICLYCRTIYVYSITNDWNCQNCNHEIIIRIGNSKIRYKCDFCFYNYFVTSQYDQTRKQKLEEYMVSLERNCIECGKRATINPINKELVCKHCGLVYEAPIHTRLQ